MYPALYITYTGYKRCVADNKKSDIKSQMRVNIILVTAQVIDCKGFGLFKPYLRVEFVPKSLKHVHKDLIFIEHP